jgi:ParB-like chromosome segregation protein Spo0J
MGKAKIPTIACRNLLADPIVVTATGVVVNGHARLAVAREIGIDEVPAIVVRHPDIRSMRMEAR